MTPKGRLRRLVSYLRRILGREEYEAGYLRDRRRGRRAKRIFILEKMQVSMDGTKNHSRPHLHLSIGRSKHAAAIAIDDGSVLAGKLKPVQARVVQKWVVRNRTTLIGLWDTFQAGKPVDELIAEFKEYRS
jgi:hypothetical protein